MDQSKFRNGTESFPWIDVIRVSIWTGKKFSFSWQRHRYRSWSQYSITLQYIDQIFRSFHADPIIRHIQVDHCPRQEHSSTQRVFHDKFPCHPLDWTLIHQPDIVCLVLKYHYRLDSIQSATVVKIHPWIWTIEFDSIHFERLFHEPSESRCKSHLVNVCAHNLDNSTIIQRSYRIPSDYQSKMLTCEWLCSILAPWELIPILNFSTTTFIMI